MNEEADETENEEETETPTKKKRFMVTMPLAGAVHLEVEADDEDAAIEEAWNLISKGAHEADDVSMEYEFYEHITQGNVIYAEYNDVEVEELD